MKTIKIVAVAILIALLIDLAAWVFRGNGVLFAQIFHGTVPWYMGR